MRFKKTEDEPIGSVNINTCVRVTTEGNRQNTEVISSVVYTHLRKTLIVHICQAIRRVRVCKNKVMLYHVSSIKHNGVFSHALINLNRAGKQSRSTMWLIRLMCLA